MTTAPLLTTGLTDEQQAIFYAQMRMAEKDEVAGVLLAFFLGIFGVHHFYLRQTGLGVLYLCFCWTGIPAILGFIECFFMPSRVQRYNLAQAMALAANLRASSPQSASARHCGSCGAAMMEGVRFCGKCGAGAA